MKPILQSNTTKTIAATGGAAAALLSLLEILQTIDPSHPWVNNPWFIHLAPWLLNMIFIPLVSRAIAKLRRKL